MELLINNLTGATRLVSAISASQTVGITINALPYPMPSIGDTVRATIPSTLEIITFTGVTGSTGAYVLTGVLRSQEGTTAASSTPAGAAIAIGVVTAASLYGAFAPLGTRSNVTGDGLDPVVLATGYTTVQFATVLEDSCNAFDPSNPTYLTVPTGATHVSISAHVDFAAITGTGAIQLHLYRNGNPTPQEFYHKNENITGNGLYSAMTLTAFTGIIPVPVLFANEKWSVVVYQTIGSSGVRLNMGASASLQMATFKFR